MAHAWQASPGMPAWAAQTWAPSLDWRALLPPPPAAPEPQQDLQEDMASLVGLVRDLTNLVDQQGRDLQELKRQVAALQRDAATVQDSKSAFIMRLTSAAYAWDADKLSASSASTPGKMSHEPEEEQLCQDWPEEEPEEEDQEEFPDEAWEEDTAEHGGKKQRLS